MLYNVTTMATTWNSVATRDTRLLKIQMDVLSGLPKEHVFLNYLRCHDDIGWGLDYDTLKWWGMEERPHKQYINDFFLGKTEDSYSRGELYNADPVTGDARFCGTTASMCGVEKAGFEKDPDQMNSAIKRDLMLHAFMFMQYSGYTLLSHRHFQLQASSVFLWKKPLLPPEAYPSGDCICSRCWPPGSYGLPDSGLRVT